MKPNELLDLNLGQVQAFFDGAEEAYAEQHVLALHSGYWAGYYSNSRRPRAPAAIARKLRRKSKRDSLYKERPDVDVEEFKRRERAFNEAREKVQIVAMRR